MIIFNIDDKEFKLIPRTRKVIALTESLKAKNLNDLMFESLNDVNVKVLAEVIKAFAEYDDEKPVFTKIDNVYDFIDKWKMENEKDYSDLFKEVIKVVNDMGFFKKKMTEKELQEMMDNPLTSINIEEIANNSVQKIMDEMAREEFKGFKG